MAHPELEQRARTVLDTILYLVLGTVDPDGRPWVSPVYFTADGCRDFYWVSSPQARHSVNIAANPDVSITVFDSTVRVGGAEAVYLRARARQLSGADLERGAALFGARTPDSATFAPDELSGAADLRMYCASATEQWALVRGGDPVFGRGVDGRVAIDLE